MFVNKNGLRVIISAGVFEGREWIHLSVSRKDWIPSWDDLRKVKVDFLGPDSYAYTVYPPASEYVNIHEKCLHIYSLESGERVLPEFSMDLGRGLKSI